MSAEKFEHHVAQALEISRENSWPFAAIGLRPSADGAHIGATVAINLDPHNPTMSKMVAGAKSYGLATVGSAKLIAAAQEDQSEEQSLDTEDISENVVDELLGTLPRVEPESPIPVEQVVIDEVSSLVNRLSEVCKANHLPVVCAVLMPVLDHGSVEIAEVQVLGYPLDDPKTLGILMSSMQGVALVSAAHVLDSAPGESVEDRTPGAGTDGTPATPDAPTAPAEPGEQG